LQDNLISLITIHKEQALMSPVAVAVPTMCNVRKNDDWVMDAEESCLEDFSVELMIIVTLQR